MRMRMLMKKTGYLHDNRYLLHDTGPYHPEMAMVNGSQPFTTGSNRPVCWIG